MAQQPEEAHLASVCGVAGMRLSKDVYLRTPTHLGPVPPCITASCRGHGQDISTQVLVSPPNKCLLVLLESGRWLCLNVTLNTRWLRSPSGALGQQVLDI